MAQNIEAVKKKDARLSVISNSSLVILKLAVGFLTGSIAIISEALHSAIDLAASIIAYLSVCISSKPPDRNHQFGHGKVENISGFLESILILVIGIFILYKSLSSLINGTELRMVYAGFFTMIFSAIVNLVIGMKLSKTADRTSSIAMKANAHHLLTDVYTSAGVAVALALIWITDWRILDPIISLCIAVYIIYLGIKLTRESIGDLIDERLPLEETKMIRRIIKENMDGISSYHKLLTRKSGTTRIIEFHLLLNPRETVENAHATATNIENRIRDHFNDSKIMIHIEPCDGKCNGCEDNNCTERDV